MLSTSTFVIGQSTTVNGRNANFVKFGNSKTAFLGSFIQRGGAKQWAEEGTKQGVTRYKFTETHRDDWSVYLTDNSRGVNIQLDLHTKKVMYSDKKNPTRRPLYNITQQYTGANGWTVCLAEFGHASGKALGSFVQKNATDWVEQNAAGKASFKFKEEGRDEWSVYLKDASRGVKIQLDLHTKKVMYSDRNNPKARVLYSIKSAR